MMMLLVLFSLLLQNFLLGTSQQLSREKNIFLLAGQSNMAGRGGVVNDTATGKTTWDGIIPPQSSPNPFIIRLASDLTWVQAIEPLHKDIDANKTNGIGPGMPFANAVLTKDKSFGVVCLVPCAIGGTKLSEWEKGTSLYSFLLTRARASVQAGGRIRALLWYQGESDTENGTDAETYGKRLENFFRNVRHDLRLPLLPIFQVALASGMGPYINEVREAQYGIHLPNFQTVDARGLPLEPDGLHLTTPAQVQLGQTLANAFLHSTHSRLLHVSEGLRSSFSFLLYLLIGVLLYLSSV